MKVVALTFIVAMMLRVAVSDGAEEPKAAGEAPQAAQPAAPPPATRLLVVDAVIDGTDELVIEASRAVWIHHQAQQPTEVALNGVAFNVRQKAELSNAGETRFLEAVRFGSATISDQVGRNPVVLLRGEKSIRLRFNDPQEGGGRYRVRITFDTIVDGDGPAPIDEPSDPSRIDRPEYADRAKAFLRPQATVKGLVVMQTPTGRFAGMAADVIATVVRGRGGPGVRPIGDVGRQMRTALDEAVRAVHVRYPKWEPGTVEISFEDKYSPKDGGSAGAAFAIALLSALEGWAIDPEAAITGDIAVNWKVLGVGGVTAKLRGAALDGAAVVVIPADNAIALADLVVLEGQRRALWTNQVLTAATLQEAVAAVRKERAEPITQAIVLYAQYAKSAAAAEDYARSDEARALLGRVVELAPNHLSARIALKFADDRLAAHLSRGESVAQIMLRSAEALRYLFDERRPSRAVVSEDLTLRVQRELRELGPMVHPDTAALLDAVSRFVEAVDAAAGADNERWPVAQQQLIGGRTAVRDAMAKLEADREFFDRLMREGG